MRLPPFPMSAAALLLALLACGLPARAAESAPPQTPTPARQQRLVRMVRQDCGSCHGMRLGGGLGPALTPAALQALPPESIAATIFHGRPGTPMPGWQPMLTESEAAWIATQLKQGFPEEPAR